jgi:hypothetical protein
MVYYTYQSIHQGGFVMCYLKPMEDSQFENYVTQAIKNDEQKLIKSGELNEKTADLEAKSTFFKLLPEG